MNDHALRTALRLRRQAVESARGDLARALDAVETTHRAERAALAAISDEAAAATSLGSDDVAVEAFAAWLPSGRQAVADSRHARDEAEATAVLARAALTAARAAEEAVESLIAQHDEAARARARAAEQRDLADNLRPAPAAGGAADRDPDSR